MDEAGRYRSRIGRPSGLRPPSVRGPAAAAGVCPAAEETAPCPASTAANPSRLPQIQSAMSRPVSRLAEPKIKRPPSPPRTRDPSPRRGAIPKTTGLRPPGSYGATSRLLSGPRAIPQPKPRSEVPTAYTVPVARVVSPPRAASPERTLAVPIQHSPIVAAPAAALPQRQIRPPSRLRRPAVETERMVAIPVVQDPGSPIKRIFIPESVAASEQGAIIAVPRTPPIYEEDRQWAPMGRRLSMEGAAAAYTPSPQATVPGHFSPRPQARPPAPCYPRPQATAPAPCSPSPQASPPAPCSPRPQASPPAPCSPRPQATVPAPCSPIETPASLGEAAAVINQVFETAAATLDQTEKEEEDAIAAALRYMHNQRRRTLLTPALTPAVCAALGPELLTKILARPYKKREYAKLRDRVLRKMYGDKTADEWKFKEPYYRPLVPPRSEEELNRKWEDLQRLAAETALIEDEEMPEYHSPPTKEQTLATVDRRWDMLMRRLYGDAYADSLLPWDYSPPSERGGLSLTRLGEGSLSPETADSAFVLAGIVEAVAQEEEAENEEYIEDITPPELVDLDDTRDYLRMVLPSPLEPERVKHLTRRVHFSPVLGSPLDSPPFYPLEYLKRRFGYRSPRPLPDSPFENPPRETPYQEFLSIDDLEAFLAGTLPMEEEPPAELNTTWEEPDFEQEEVRRIFRRRRKHRKRRK